MKKRRTKRLVIIICAVILAGVVFVLINNYALSTTYSIYHTDKTQNKVRIVLLSDLHGISFGHKNRNLVNIISTQKPDIVLLAGDMYGENIDTEPVSDLIEGLSGVCEHIYYSFGNHEDRREDYREKMESSAKRAGAVVLNNASDEIRIGDTDIMIYGLDLPLYYYSGYDEKGELLYTLSVESIEEYIGKASNNLNILIAHNPVHFESYADWGADVVVSGHNHGGTVRLPFWGGLASPNGDKWNKHYDCGEYKKGKTTMYLSRGLGEWVGPVRAFNLPEVYVIDIDKK